MVIVADLVSLIKIYVEGTQKNSLNEAALVGTPNKCLD